MAKLLKSFFTTISIIVICAALLAVVVGLFFGTLFLFHKFGILTILGIIAFGVIWFKIHTEYEDY